MGTHVRAKALVRFPVLAGRGTAAPRELARECFACEHKLLTRGAIVCAFTPNFWIELSARDDKTDSYAHTWVN